MIHFKTATPSDAEDLSKLINSAYRGDSSKRGWTTEADLLDGQRTDPESLKSIIQTADNQIEMAHDSKTQLLVGCVHLKKENEHSLYFGMLTVAPNQQSLGLGKMLILHLEEIARRSGLSQIRISVIRHRKELIAFYERRGFFPTGHFEAFPEEDPRFGIPKVKNLKLIEYLKKI